MPDELTEQLVSVNGRAVAAVTADGKERAGQTADTSPVTQVDGPLVRRLLADQVRDGIDDAAHRTRPVSPRHCLRTRREIT